MNDMLHKITTKHSDIRNPFLCHYIRELTTFTAVGLPSVLLNRWRFASVVAHWPQMYFGPGQYWDGWLIVVFAPFCYLMCHPV